MTKTIHGDCLDVLMLGAGVQSSALLLLAERGDIPKPDMAIFSDTQWEPPEVYEHLEWLCRMVKTIPIIKVTKGDIRADGIASRVRDTKRWASMPLFTKSPEGDIGSLRRQCTKEYKIDPIDKYIRRELFGLKHGQWMPREVVVRKWFGITSDEAQRITDSKVKWASHLYPFCNHPDTYFDLNWTRHNCQIWLEENYKFQKVPRSACLGCPFHSDKEWLEIKKNPASWKDVVDFDRAIRKQGGMRGDMFLHRSCLPLDEVYFKENQGEFNFGGECEGMCGV
jgi:hypothetical protein